jgi:hypothetical protein
MITPESARPETTSAAPQPKGAELSRDELLRYIELELWSRFSARLWGLLAGSLLVGSLATLFGVTYYIRSEIEQRLHEQQTTFALRAEETIKHGELLSLAAVRYYAARFEIQSHTSLLLAALHARDDSSAKGSSSAPLDGLIRDLERARSLNNYLPVLRTLEAAVPRASAARLFVPGDSVTESTKTLQGAVTITSPHPVQDGTLLGAVRDLRFRLVELEAYRLALEDLESDISALGASSPLERRQSRVSLATLHDEAFGSRYSFYRNRLAREYLSGVPLNTWTTYSPLYSLDSEVSLRDATPSPSLQRTSTGRSPG